MWKSYKRICLVKQLVSNSIKCKKQKVNIIKDVLLKKNVRYSVNRIQTENHELKKPTAKNLSCFDGKICILDNAFDLLASFA